MKQGILPSRDRRNSGEGVRDGFLELSRRLVFVRLSVVPPPYDVVFHANTVWISRMGGVATDPSIFGGNFCSGLLAGESDARDCRLDMGDNLARR